MVFLISFLCDSHLFQLWWNLHTRQGTCLGLLHPTDLLEMLEGIVGTHKCGLNINSNCSLININLLTRLSFLLFKFKIHFYLISSWIYHSLIYKENLNIISLIKWKDKIPFLNENNKLNIKKCVLLLQMYCFNKIIKGMW